jgi:anti-anti-sigma factor
MVEMSQTRAISLVRDCLAELDIGLSAVAFISSSGLSALVSIRNATLQSGVALRRRAPSERVRRVRRIPGLLTVSSSPTDRLRAAAYRGYLARVPRARRGT